MPFTPAAEESPVIGERPEDFGHVDKCLKNALGSVEEAVSKSDTLWQSRSHAEIAWEGVCMCPVLPREKVQRSGA